MNNEDIPRYILITMCLTLVVLLISLFKESVENEKKARTFTNVELITINKDTIKGDFYLVRTFGNISYLNLKDSTKYNINNVVSLKKIKSNK